MNKIDFLLHSPIAHRGVHNAKAPENSLTAFQKAVKGRFPIELDVHLIKSGEVVVIHDDSLKRMRGIDKSVANCTMAEIREVYLMHTREHIPLLTEVLDVVKGKVPLLIEFKCDQPAGKLEQAVLDILKGYKGKYAVQSFSPLSLRWLKKNAPKIPRGQLFSIFKPACRNALACAIGKPDFLVCNFHALPNKCVEKIRVKQKIPVLGWTVTKVSDSKEALKHCDNIICEKIL